MKMAGFHNPNGHNNSKKRRDWKLISKIIFIFKVHDFLSLFYSEFGLMVCDTNLNIMHLFCVSYGIDLPQILTLFG